MRSFREFLIEATATGAKTPPVGHLQQRGFFNFPDMHDLADPDRAPPGGWRGYAQKAAAQIQKNRREGPDRELWVAKDILEKFQQLAEQAAASIINREQGKSNDPDDYKGMGYSSARWADNARQNIILSGADIESGRYPQVRAKDLQWGVDQKIFQQTQAGWYLLNVNTLMQTSLQMKQQLKEKSYQDEVTMYRANQMDQYRQRLLGGLKSAFGGSGEIENRALTVK